MKKTGKVLTSITCCAVALCMVPLFACGGNKKSSIVIMSEELSGLFNPFYATTGADQEIIGVTQIGMLSTDSDGNITCGEDEATAVLDYSYVTPEDENYDGENSVYTFVLKNDLVFSDGEPLTMNDVLFNLYEYLDPVYTGSSTIYSTEIVGLNQYRTQENYSDDTVASEAETALDEDANGAAQDRIQQLINVYEDSGYKSAGSYELSEKDMKVAINNLTNVSAGYYKAAGIEEGNLSEAKAQLLKDYDHALETFRKELEDDYVSAQEAYDVTSAPYNSNAELVAAISDSGTGDIYKFMMYEGYVTFKYGDKAPDENGKVKKDYETIEDFSPKNFSSLADKDAAIDKVYGDKVLAEFNSVLSYWGTASTLATEYAAEYKGKQLQDRTDDETGEMKYPNISGIVSLGHKVDGEYQSKSSVSFTSKVDGKTHTYNVARNHDENGVPTDAGTYDILQVTVKGTDPKAIYNFSFSVAPQHYYAKNEERGTVEPVDIENNQFGVKYADYGFQASTIQSDLHNGVPVGAGPYKATDVNNNDSGITRQSFKDSGNVFFKANDNFMFDVKQDSIIFREVSSTNAIDSLANGEIDYAEPQFTKANSDTLNGMKGINTLAAWQLGYGYIGINAGKVKSLNLRKAMMSAMQTDLATDYYSSGTCTTIYWPMSVVSWAYPKDADGNYKTNNGHEYAGQFNKKTDEQEVIDRINQYTNAARNESGFSESDLKITLTISGSSVSEHPTYQVFLRAMELLNECGWDVEVRADTQALTKLATGSLAVWAAAWGSTIDPDMYQVYHFNSTASSTYAWGYREIKADPTTYDYEYKLIKNTLSPVIDQARETADQEKRTALYEEAMGYVLDLAVELPVYQRENLFAYNSKTLGGLNSEVNPYSSPLEKIWEIYLIK